MAAADQLTMLLIKVDEETAVYPSKALSRNGCHNVLAVPPLGAADVRRRKGDNRRSNRSLGVVELANPPVPNAAYTKLGPEADSLAQ